VSGLVGLTRLEERILVLAPTGRDGALAAELLGRAQLAADVFRDAASLATTMDEGAGAVLIAEEALSPAALESLTAALERQPPWSDLPVLVFVAAGERHAFPDRLERMSSLLGNVTLVERPVRVATLVTAVRAALRARRRQYAARATMEALQLREAELRVADQRKDEFLAMLAHELRNPMAALSVALDLLAADGGAAREARLHATARRQVQHLVRLVDDLLELSRITRGTFELRKVDLDLREVFEASVNDARPLLGTRDIEVVVNSADRSVPVHADATRLEQVIGNLLSNAAKFTEPGGRVEISLGTSGDEAVLVVRDTGRGIPARMTAQVFEPFVQVDPGLDRAKGGLGLGLTLVRRMVEMHGGTVRASSDGPGRGSTFEVRLPLQVTGDEQPASTSAPVPHEERPAPRRVVVVEDSPDLRETLAEFLRSLGHEVELAATGPEGAEKLVTVRPDVALVDIGLPGMDGYEVARAVRERPEGRSLFLVALTGYGGADVEDTARRAGFDVHLVKPVEMSRLMALIEGAPAGARR